MNILILVNPAKDYKRFFYFLSLALIRQGHTIYYAMDSVRSKYIDSIPEIDDNINTFYFDKFLKENFNKDKSEYLFDTTWGEYYYSNFDRFFVQGYNLDKSCDFWIKTRISLDNFFLNLIQTKNINLVLYENISNSFEYSASKMIEKKGGLYLGLISSRIPNRYEIQTSIIEKQLERIKVNKSNNFSDEEKAWYAEYNKNILNIQPDYMINTKQPTFILEIFKKKYILRFFNTLHYFFSGKWQYDYANGHPLKDMWRGFNVKLRRSLNGIQVNNCFLSNNEIEEQYTNDSFFIYPMHYHPESSTSVLAPSYTNEFHNILNISNNLPFGTFLYVKEHISAFGSNNKKFYNKIKALPAVKLIAPTYNIKKLIQKSKGVITVNSTAGYEALILGKPVFLLGRVFYENFANVYKLNNFNEIYNKVQNLDDFKDITEDVIAYRRYTLPGCLNFSANEKSLKYFDDIAQQIIKTVKDLK